MKKLTRHDLLGLTYWVLLVCVWGCMCWGAWVGVADAHPSGECPVCPVCPPAAPVPTDLAVQKALDAIKAVEAVEAVAPK